MKKIAKLFLVVLTTASFSLSSAYAGELTVTGGATATYKIGGAVDAAGPGLGVSNEIDFTANGELDNGFTWTWQTQLDDAGTVNDDTRLEVGTPYGTVGFYISENDISSKLGYGIGALGVGSDYTGPATVQWGATMNTYNNIGYSTPAGMLPFGGSVKVAYSPNLSSTQGASAKADGAVETLAVGSDATQYRVDFQPIDGLSVGADYMTVSGGLASIRYKQESAGAYAKYVAGPFSVGYARTGYQPNEAKAATLGSDGSVNYETDQYGIQFAVNENFTISWSTESSTKHTSKEISGAGATTVASDITMDIDHIQAAYVIGGATVGIAIADASNSDYTTSKDEKVTTLSLAMAF